MYNYNAEDAIVGFWPGASENMMESIRAIALFLKDALERKMSKATKEEKNEMRKLNPHSDFYVVITENNPEVHLNHRGYYKKYIERDISNLENYLHLIIHEGSD